MTSLLQTGLNGHLPAPPEKRFLISMSKDLGIEMESTLDAVLRSADIVSLHVPLTKDTRGLMDADRFAAMKEGAIFINAARGGLVDEAALLDTLERKHLRGAGIDVFHREPPSADHPLIQRNDVVATPHVAGLTTACKARMQRMALTNAMQVLRANGDQLGYLEADVAAEVLERVKQGHPYAAYLNDITGDATLDVNVLIVTAMQGTTDEQAEEYISEVVTPDVAARFPVRAKSGCLGVLTVVLGVGVFVAWLTGG